MADQDRPNQNANKSKAEGERPAQGRNSPGDEHPERNYPADDRDNAGGITNRPISEEVENQERLPERGTQKNSTSNPGSTRPEGDYAEDQV